MDYTYVVVVIYDDRPKETYPCCTLEQANSLARSWEFRNHVTYCCVTERRSS